MPRRGTNETSLALFALNPLQKQNVCPQPLQKQNILPSTPAKAEHFCQSQSQKPPEHRQAEEKVHLPLSSFTYRTREARVGTHLIILLFVQQSGVHLPYSELHS